MIQCLHCQRPFSDIRPVASISGSILGDEVTDSYFLCPECGVYTVAKWWDNFTGEETLNLSGPITKEEGKDQIELIGKCSRPWDKKCRCEAHRAYFRDILD